MFPLPMNPHLTLTLSPPIRWERRGNSRRTRTVLWKPESIRQVQGFNARNFRGILTLTLSHREREQQSLAYGLACNCPANPAIRYPVRLSTILPLQEEGRSEVGLNLFS